MDDGLSPIYRPDHFYPLPMGATVMLLGTGGPVKADGNDSPFFFIDYAEPVFGLNQHGVTVLWTHTAAAAPAGYELPSGVASGVIAAGGQVTSAPGVFNLAIGELLQFRFILRPLVFLGVGGVNRADDIDLEVSLPASVNRWTVLNGRGRLNMMAQVGMPGDAAAGPAQGANIAAQQVQPFAAPWDSAHWTELFAFEQTGPTFTLVNNGAAATAAGDAVGIYVWGYRYIITAARNDGSWTPRLVPGGGGVPLMAPPRAITVPISGRGR